MMFKKGSFEIGGTIYPVAIKVSSVACVARVTASAVDEVHCHQCYCYWKFSQTCSFIYVNN